MEALHNYNHTKQNITQTDTVTITTVCMRAHKNAYMHPGMHKSPGRKLKVVSSSGDRKEEPKSYGFVWGGLCVFPEMRLIGPFD